MRNRPELFFCTTLVTLCGERKMCLSPSNQIGLNCLHSSFYVVSRAICKPGLQLLFKRGRLKKKKKKKCHVWLFQGAAV